MIRILKKQFNVYIDEVLNRTLTSTNRGIHYSIIRFLLCRIKFTRMIYNYRAGNISKCQLYFKTSKPRNVFEKRLKDRIVEMNIVCQKGWPSTIQSDPKKVEYNGRVLFALHNSLPHDGAGYAIRSQNVIESIARKGVTPNVVTRPNYPWDLNNHSDKLFEKFSNVNSIKYMRIKDDDISIGGNESDYIHSYGDHLAKLAQENSASIIHAASNYLNGMAAARAAINSDAKAIFEIRGMWHWSRAIKEPYFKNSDHQRYCEIMERAAAHEVDHVVTISKGLKSLVSSWGVPEKKISVIPNGVNTEYFTPLKKDMRLAKELGLENRVVVGFIGSLTFYEGIDIIIQAVGELINEGLPVSLVIVGQGVALKSLVKMAKKTGATDHIHFLGYIPYDLIGSYYSIIDIFPFPRKSYDVCQIVPPLKIFEVMAMAKVTIVSKLEVLENIIQDGETGWVCVPEDVNSLKFQLENLIMDEKNRKKVGSAAREYVKQNHDWSRITQQYIDIYQSICS